MQRIIQQLKQARVKRLQMSYSPTYSLSDYIIKAGFPLGEFFRANRERSNLIGWRQTLTTSPANHIRFLLVRANKFA